MSQAVAGGPELEAARLMLERMGISPADLLGVRPPRPQAPTFAEYVPWWPPACRRVPAVFSCVGRLVTA